MTSPELPDLLGEYTTALAYTDALYVDLSQDEVHWRPVPESSAIGWHLGHQAAVAHYMMRNLTAAEPPIDPALDALMDSATVETQRGELPDLGVISNYRKTVGKSVRHTVDRIERGDVGAPAQLRRIAEAMMTAIINHEYQHSKWIGETRSEQFGHDMPDTPTSDFLTLVDGYVMVG